MSQQIDSTIGTEMKRVQLVALLIGLVLPFLAALVGGIATARSVQTWYKALEKPRWNPPSWVFGPVWTALYATMGVASWLVWRQGRKDIASKTLATSGQAQDALKLYGVHLIFNALWSVLFFGVRRIDWALAEIGVLWSLIAATTVRFYHVRPAAGLLMVPYLLWTSFASALNFVIWRKNRGAAR